MLKFNTLINHTIVAADRNVYVSPTLHSDRKLTVHDLIYITNGEFEIGLDNQIYTAKKDDVLILPAHIFHFGIKPCSPQTKTMYIHASCEKNDGYFTGKKRILSDNCISLNPLIKTGENIQVKNLFIEIVNLYNRGMALRASAYFTLLLCELYDCDDNKTKRQKIAYQVRNIIDNNLYENFSNNEIADTLSSSARRIEIAFKSIFGTSIHQYSINKKIEKSKEYLLFFPEMKTIDIAVSLGFYDEYHFSKLFKSRIGLPPQRIPTQISECRTYYLYLTCKKQNRKCLFCFAFETTYTKFPKTSTKRN